ncbi:MAG: GNAT family N-acetyltransferase [Pseudobdellovibrionaceae bacterium]
MTRHDPTLTEKIFDKAVAYIIRKASLGYELLVFDHDEEYSDAGTQVPAGTVDGTEDPKVTVFREVLEESGLNNLLLTAKIDEYVFYRDTHKQYNRRHVFLLEPQVELPDRWTHQVRGDGVDCGHNFHYFWISLNSAKGRLSARLDDSIEKLQRYLQIRDDLQFVPINLEKDQNLCVQFRIDTFVCSFGNAELFYKVGGPDHYLTWLKNKIEKNPKSAVHVKFNGEIIGQMELGCLKESPDIGYVNLYYLAPEHRGQGFSAHLDAFAMKYMMNQGCKIVRLSVSPTNKRAVRFYEKQGWRDVGPRPNHPEVHFMEKSLE